MVDTEQFEPDPNKRGIISKINKIIAMENGVKDKMGIPRSHEADEKRRRELGKYNSYQLGNWIEDTQTVIDEMKSEQRAKQTEALHASGVLSRKSDSTRER